MSDELNRIAEEVMVEEGRVLKVINGKKYVIQMLPAMQGVSLAKRILKSVVPLLGMWADGEKKEDFILPEEDNLFAELALMFNSKLDELNVEEVIAALVSGLTCDGKEVEFNTHFRQNYSELLLVLEEALRGNFGSFFVEYLEAKGINFQEGLKALKTRMSANETAE